MQDDVAKRRHVRPFNLKAAISEGRLRVWGESRHIRDPRSFRCSYGLFDADVAADCADDPDKAEECAKVVTLAKAIGARTTATGIETLTVLKVVHQIGFDLGEGDLFGKAMDAQRFARTVVRGHAK